MNKMPTVSTRDAIKALVNENPKILNSQLVERLHRQYGKPRFSTSHVANVRKTLGLPCNPCGRKPQKSYLTKPKDFTVIAKSVTPTTVQKPVTSLQLNSVDLLVAALREQAKKEHGKRTQVHIKIVPGSYNV